MSGCVIKVSCMSLHVILLALNVVLCQEKQLGSVGESEMEASRTKMTSKSRLLRLKRSPQPIEFEIPRFELPKEEEDSFHFHPHFSHNDSSDDKGFNWWLIFAAVCFYILVMAVVYYMEIMCKQLGVFCWNKIKCMRQGSKSEPNKLLLEEELL